MLINLDRSVFVLGWLVLWSVLIVAVGLGTSGVRADTSKAAPASVHTPSIESVETIGTHRVEFIVTPDSITTLDIEPGTLTLYN